jgi:hypothetical protein
LNCEAFCDRLYDNDARAAGRGLGDVPSDMAAHMIACDRCRAAYDAALTDDRLLTRALLDVPSPAWRAEVLRRMSRSPRAWSQRIAMVNEIVIWGILAMGTSQMLLGASSTAAYVAAFSAGATVLLLRTTLVKHWQVVRRPLRWV